MTKMMIISPVPSKTNNHRCGARNKRLLVRPGTLLLLHVCCCCCCCFIAVWILRVQPCFGFSLIMMGGKGRRGKVNLKGRLLDENMSRSSSSSSNKTQRQQQQQQVGSLNKGKGQEITGVTLPAEGQLKGWEFGQGVRIAVANVNGNFYAVQGDCPRCAFDLWKGDIIAADKYNDAFEDLPRVACPTCSTTYSLRTGQVGPPLKRTGLQSFVGALAKSATEGNSMKDAKAFLITRDDDGRVYCREKRRSS